MKIAIISDLHFPKNISQQTILYSESGYTDAFYESIEEQIKKFQPNNIGAFIIDGDFYWDYKEFAPLPIIPPNNQWNFYNMFIFQLVAMRQWLHSEIPLILIEGNHDPWFETCVYSKNGEAFVNLTHYADFLIVHYKLTEFQANKVIELLPRNSSHKNRFEIGSNMHLLRNSGILIQNFYIYGFPYHNKELDNTTWKEHRETMIEIFLKKVAQIQKKRHNKSAMPILVCHHGQPKTPKIFFEQLNGKKQDIIGIFWGHWHGVSDEDVAKLRISGKFYNVMPEKNSWNIPIFEI
ncbi:hypothetical protein NEF87_002340 [Candidatus Lokiarchaeum ossiferum]|uniref:Calcineurin-like phosphoesterase domain-containing protein n=1 Tax=Candidatus Lokiarchaeum ossiferum TaxID=2951803 RepID=A0ABY6HRM2_9ARCH|nr:hypothetical protein NEF87_002340 [Candidatus Lokiarchaeum sp. B-35]